MHALIIVQIMLPCHPCIDLTKMYVAVPKIKARLITMMDYRHFLFWIIHRVNLSDDLSSGQGAVKLA